MKVYSNEAICTALRKQAKEIADAGHNGWGGLSSCAADHIEELARSSAGVRATALKEAAKICEAMVFRPAGYQGQWEGYGTFVGYTTGPECAAAIRAKAKEGA